MGTYLLDTDVISELMAAPGRKRRQKIEGWLRSLGEEPIMLSSVSISEINRGVALLDRRNVVAAKAIRKALSDIVSLYGDAIITPNHEEWQTFAEITAIPELRHLCYGKNRKNQPRTGADVFLAIQANTIGAAVASLNVDDFEVINGRFPIVGGIINAALGVWVIQPAGQPHD